MNTELTREQKRIKIAEADGWSVTCQRIGGCLLSMGHASCCCQTGDCDHQRDAFPNYFKDRNACIEVILKMNPIKRQDFIHALTSVVAPASQWHEMHLNELFNFLTATPDQLCEAIGATLDLW